MSDLDLTPAFGHPLRRPASWRGSRNPRYDRGHAVQAPHVPVLPLAIAALAVLAGLAVWLLSNPPA